MKVIPLALAALLAGCSTSPSYRDTASQQMAVRNCSGAAATIQASGDSPGNKAYGMAGVHEHCTRNRQQAIHWATISARYGVQPARDYLASIGARVPSADLVSAPEYSSADALATFVGAAADSYADAQKRRNSGREMNCESVRNAEGTVSTKCKER